MNKRTGIITQARTTSTRLPGKVLLSVNGKTVLEHHIRRLLWSSIPVYIATTTNNTDDAIATLADAWGVGVFRGDEMNVLERFYRTAEKFHLDTIVRVTSDCPLVDGEIIARAVDEYDRLDNENVYLSNCLQRTFPRGLDFEIFSFKLLKEAFLSAVDAFDKEHVTPYINRNKSGNVVVKHILYGEDWSNLRWTLDTPDDWTLIKTLFETFDVREDRFEQVLQKVKNNSEVLSLNSHVKQKEG